MQAGKDNSHKFLRIICEEQIVESAQLIESVFFTDWVWLDFSEQRNGNHVIKISKFLLLKMFVIQDISIFFFLNELRAFSFVNS